MGLIRVGVVGAGGRMGTSVCQAVAADPALELVAAVDPHATGQVRNGIEIHGELRALADAEARGRRRLHGRCCVADDGSVAGDARHPRGGGHHRADRRRPRRVPDRVQRQQLHRRQQLRNQRGADDALRRAGGAVLRHRRDHRAAPRREDRCALRDRGDHRQPDGGGQQRVGAGPHAARGLPGRSRRRRARPASMCTPSACAAWWRTRK